MCKGKLRKPMEEVHYVVLFNCVNDNKNVDFKNKIMSCILCHDNLINATNPKT
jgi:hypothetical protein